MSKTTFNSSLKRNAGKPCKHPNCSYPRHRISSWCREHGARVNKYGHPDGVYIHPKQIDKERQEATEFIKANLNHPGIASALKWLQAWQEMSISSDPMEKAKQPPGIDAMNRLNANEAHQKPFWLRPLPSGSIPSGFPTGYRMTSGLPMPSPGLSSTWLPPTSV